MDSLSGFLNNAALMLILCVIYDTFSIYLISNKPLRDCLTGVLVGLICIAVMLTPWSLEKGLYFDTRWVLLSLCGLYFGFIPTAVAVVFAGTFRLYQGGPGGIVGTVVIVVTACVGLAWRYWKDKQGKPLNCMQLYVFGIVVQLAMLSCMFLFPADLRNAILRKVALPILLIYPVLTTIIGIILKRQQDRRVADKELLYSTSLATAALESTPDGILIVDREGKITRWNQKFIELWQVPVMLLEPPSEYAPLHMHIVARMSRQDEFIAKVAELYKHPEESSSDTLYLADGRIFERYSQPQKVGKEIVGRFWSFRDITERKTAEESIRASEAKFRTIFDSSNDAIFIHDVESGAIVDINQRTCEMYGLTRTEALQTTVGDISANIPPYCQEDAENWLKRAAEGQPQLFEWHARHKNGTLFWVEVSMNRAVIGTTDRILVTLRDITGRKQTEEALASSERFLKAIIDSEPECIKMLDSNGKVLMMNPAGLEMIGADSLEQIKGQCVCPLVTPPYRDAFIALTKQVFQGTSGTLEFEMISLKGRHVWLESHAVPFCNERGEIMALLGITRDITERKREEEERARLEQQLLNAQKLESLGVLAGGIAHDFNNILTVIMGNISYAKMDLDVSQHAKEPLARAEKAVKRAAGLAKQLLVFAKGGDPVKKSISVQQSVNDAVSLALSGTTVQAVIDLPTDLYAINADEGQISQVFDNIIINAVQAMPDKGSLTISAKNVAITEDNSLGLSAGDYVKISFSDEGCGIAAENVGRIFDPYFTTKVGGSGLGLSSTYAIINKHGGRISVSSSPGKGTIFTILIPACGEPVNEELKETHAPGNAQGIYSILVMDDDEMVSELAEITLKRLGYTVVCCRNGAAAVSLYRSALEERAPFSLVIMDLTIPGGMGGVEAARQILSFDPKAQLIVSSGYSDDPVMANFSDYGFCASLEKPYNVEEIAMILKKTHKDKLPGY